MELPVPQLHVHPSRYDQHMKTMSDWSRIAADNMVPCILFAAQGDIWQHPYISLLFKKVDT